MQKELTLHNDMEELSLFNDWVDGIAEETSMPSDDLFQLKMALEEALVNVIDYAYPGQTGMPISLKVDVNDDEYSFELSDSGVKFNPLADSNAPDLELGAEDRPIGGLGIFLVKQYMQDVNYSYNDGQNVLSMKYRLGTTPADLDIMDLV